MKEFYLLIFSGTLIHIVYFFCKYYIFSFYLNTIIINKIIINKKRRKIY